MVRRLVTRLDRDLRTDYQAWKKDTLRASLGLQPIHIHALYARSFFPDVNFVTGSKEAYRFYLDQTKAQWAAFDPALQAMVAILMHRRGDANAAAQILEGLREQAIRDPKTGMHWKGAKIGWAKYLGPVQAQCLMIEAFHEVGKDVNAVTEMQQWLLGRKRLSNWGSTMATADACYALLLNHRAFATAAERPSVTLNGGGVPIKPQESSEATGTAQWLLNPSDFTRERAIEIRNPSTQPMWGAVYNLTAHSKPDLSTTGTALQVKKSLWTVPDDKHRKAELVSGHAKLRPGQELTVRLEFEAGEDFSFVHIHDQRSSGFEPVKVLSECSLQASEFGTTDPPPTLPRTFSSIGFPRGGTSSSIRSGSAIQGISAADWPRFNACTPLNLSRIQPRCGSGLRNEAEQVKAIRGIAGSRFPRGRSVQYLPLYRSIKSQRSWKRSFSNAGTSSGLSTCSRM
ncbi:MAG: hypothetical protein U0176_23495 [Bacteroidia bacterium]